VLGANFSAVDPYALMLCRWTRNFARPARSRPHIAPYLQRMLARPAVQRAFAAERLSAPMV
jgi:glutathione S-transferase